MKFNQIIDTSMKKTVLLPLFFFLIIVYYYSASLPNSVFAIWSSDPSINTPVVTDTGYDSGARPILYENG
ncbi:MAG: hypothetical protein NUV98_02485, partial [Candidatus Roizmanbacteria bacterium]|nr:hypothetical protein [Candidatus Roizmanbacteria bacterium]